MQTVAENLRRIAQDIQILLEEFLLKHSSIYRWNEEGSWYLSVTGDYGFRDLDLEGRRLQSRLIDEYQRYYALTSILLRSTPDDTQKALAESNTILTRTIEQKHTWCTSTREAFERAQGALQTQLDLLERLYDGSEGQLTLVPDTNALLFNTRLERWELNGEGRFTIVLVPTVLSELDALKMDYRNASVQQKAEKLIRQINEYRRRGKLLKGVPILKGKIDIMSVAKEPDFEQTLPWLDATNNDDRLLASVIEVMRARPRSPVAIVTRDVNLHNKAEFAGVSSIEPPAEA